MSDVDYVCISVNFAVVNMAPMELHKSLYVPIMKPFMEHQWSKEGKQAHSAGVDLYTTQHTQKE